MLKCLLRRASACACLGFLSHGAFAGECVLQIERTACPAKETESFAKCNGKKSCDESKKTSSAETCTKEAVKACQNKRFDITQDKKITATFDGKSVESGKDFCAAATAGVFDPAKDFPHRGKKDCK